MTHAPFRGSQMCQNYFSTPQGPTFHQSASPLISTPAMLDFCLTRLGRYSPAFRTSSAKPHHGSSPGSTTKFKYDPILAAPYKLHTYREASPLFASENEQAPPRRGSRACGRRGCSCNVQPVSSPCRSSRFRPSCLFRVP